MVHRDIKGVGGPGGKDGAVPKRGRSRCTVRVSRAKLNSGFGLGRLKSSMNAETPDLGISWNEQHPTLLGERRTVKPLSDLSAIIPAKKALRQEVS